MKKFIALLMVGGLLLTGCGQQESADVPANTVAEENVTADIVSDSAVGVTSDSAIESENTENAETDDRTEFEKHEILADDPKSHSAKNAPADDSVEYFPEILRIGTAEELADTAYMTPDIITQYDYAYEHRTFDFLEYDDAMEASDITGENLLKIADYILNEYLDEHSINEEDCLIGKQYNPAAANRYAISIRTDKNIRNYTAPCDNIIIYHTIDDPNNGVTVLYVYGTPSDVAAVH